MPTTQTFDPLHSPETVAQPSIDHIVRRRRPVATVGSIVGLVILIVAAVFALGPLLWTLTTSLRTPAESFDNPPQWLPLSWDFSNYAAVFDQIPIGQFFLNSVVVTLLIVVGQTVTCTLSGYAFAMISFPGKNTVFGIFLATMLVPIQTIIITVFVILKDIGLTGSIASLIVPALGSAFGTFLMRTAFLNMPPELEEAARMDGANPFQTFWRIMLPLARPSISVLAITTVLWSWNELLWPLVVSTRAEDMPLAAGLATLSSDRTIDYPVLMAASLMAMAPVLIMFVVLQRRVMDGLASSGLK
ncbi:carbohydrate ABC transporter permease [Bacillus altitudinis]|uniref:carbohydrate ABC transporter permease n=1 Tax=Bacillus altitudinis TaxID=293387 RepID=UPI0012F158EA|nr:Sugar ABC transporter permease [Bacillus altitudinis]